MRRFSAILATAAAVLAVAAPVATADVTNAGGVSNVVMASSSSANPTDTQSRLQTAFVGGDVVAPVNLAQAQASDCTGCRSVAVAVQAVFVGGSPSVFTPTNAATAVNDNCTSCVSFAYAWQETVQTPGPVRLTRAGKRHIRTLRSEISDAASSDLPPDQLQARLDELTTELDTVIHNQIEKSGQPADTSVHEQVDAGPTG